MPKYKFYLEPGFTVDQWYAFNLAPELVYDYFTTGSDNLLFGSYATPEEIASGEVHRWIQVYPGVTRDIAIEYDIWDHKYRKKLKGDLTFLNNQLQNDYSILADIIDTSLEVKIRIEQTCVTSSSDWWEGYFSIVDGSWDADRGLFTVSASPDDTYRMLEELGDHEYNLYSLNPTVQTQINFTDITEYAYSACTVMDDSQWQDHYDPQGHLTDPYSYPDLWTGYVLTDTTPCSGGNVYTWERVLNQNFDFGNSRGLLLEDAVQYLVNTIGGLDYVSTFLENDEYPSGNTDIPIGTKNYVTLVDPNPLNGMVVYQKSDIRLTSDRATLWNVTFNDLMDILKTMFNIDWFIDDEGKFRIEHWSYFENTAASDTDLTLLDSGKWINKKNKWSYEIEDMPTREHFEWAEANSIDFFGRDIIYNNIATFNRYKDNIKSFSIPVTTDAKYMYNNSSDISNEGWAIVTVASDIIVNEVGLLSGVVLPNNHLSWANLHYNYHRHGRVISKGNMNGSDIVFLSCKRLIKQEEITYPECCGTFDPMAYKITELGEGEVRAAEYKLIDGSVKTVFFYLDVKASNYPVGETYYILINGFNELIHNGGTLIWYG
jgi:hypothetical protein